MRFTNSEVLMCVKGAKVMLLTCLPRYLHNSCCADPGHMVDKDKSNQASDLTQIKKAVRSFIFAEKLKDVQVVDPTMLCTTAEPGSWEDPVHLNGKQFAKLADGLAGMIAGVEEVLADGEHGADKPDAKRIRLLSCTVPYGLGGHSTGGRGRGGQGTGRGRGGRSLGRRGWW